ncbi:MAG TPA: hypothetical protein VEY91_12155 [Candidatus Limnocylindria bacterium]|nr:hypothetical protein [Candidatus Limnocylindria bacterium]
MTATRAAVRPPDARENRGWRRVWSALFGEPVRLPEAVLERWPELRAGRFWRGGLPPTIGGWLLGAPSVAGIALGRRIWLARDTVLEPELLLHEVRHLQQFALHRGFALRYLWETLRRGYQANRFEIDARRYASERMRCVAWARPLEETAQGGRDHPVVEQS